MFVIVIVLVLVVCIIIALMLVNIDQIHADERRQVMTNALATLQDFKPSTKIVGIKSLYTIAFDHDQQKMLFLVGKTPRVFNYADIISVQLLEDNQTVSQKSTGRTIGGALVGGVLAGGAGAIVGGLSGSSKNLNLHSSVKVKILLRNSSSPSIMIDCFNASTMTVDGKSVNDESVENYIYKQGLDRANRIVDMISVIIDAVDRATNTQVQQTQSNSTAEEIAKLAILKEKGILTEEEFADQKRKLLDGSYKSISNTNQKKLILSLPEPDPIEEEVRNLAISGKKLEAIKKYQEYTGCDRGMAMDYVDSIY